MRIRWMLSVASVLGLMFASASASAAPPVLRHQADVRGDARVIGSSLAVDCHTSESLPGPVLHACASELETADTAPDLYWRDGEASALIAPSAARTAATLELPAGAKVAFARLYWASLRQGADPDQDALLDCPSCSESLVHADATHVEPHPYNPDWYFYQASADVTGYVAAHGADAYRVSGVDGIPLAGVSVDVAFAAWTMVVFYEAPSEPLRNLALFDGLFHVDPPAQGSFVETKVELSGFLVPAGFDAKMSAFAYEGDHDYPGDHFAINGVAVSNGQGNADNFFNSSRTWLGAPVSGASDSPKLSGLADSMSGYDLHTVDVSSLVKANDTTAVISADSIYDKFYLGGFVTSLTDRAPHFGDLTKTVKDLNGGSVLTGDELEYTIQGTNTGSDAAVNATVTDALELGIALVPGSIKIVSGGVIGPKTDAAGDDQAEYVSSTKTVVVRVGSGATAAQGGVIAVGDSFEVSFRAKVIAKQGEVANHALLTARGQAGGLEKTWQTDADFETVGYQDTVVTVQECQSDADCGGSTPHCELSSHACMPCATDADCTDKALPVCQPDGSCAECSPDHAGACKDPQPVCIVAENKPRCGCDDDGDCGDATSGRVCDRSVSRCMDGCRGEGGNGCPTDRVCTSTDSSIGQCVDRPEPEDPGQEATPETLPEREEGGCACATAGGGAAGTWAWVLAMGALAIARLRRRAR